MAFPYIFTFYSFKGGVGRSMAAANVAYALASRGRHVLLVDMDLEAPGLSTFFRESEEIGKQSPLDVLDILGWAHDWAELHPGDKLDFDAICKEGPNLGAYTVRVPDEKVTQHRLGEVGRLDLLLVDPNRDYLQRLGDLHLPELSRDLLVRMSRALWAYFKSRRFPPDISATASQTEHPYDYVLVDSRTGLTEIGALCIGPLADRLVVLTGLNVQNLKGTADFLGIVGVAKVREEGDPQHDEADAPPSEPNTPPRLGPKPTIFVASPVPIGETGLKVDRMDELHKRLKVPPASTLTYHPLLALKETIFVRDLPQEQLTSEYLNLADCVMAMVGDRETRPILQPLPRGPQKTLHFTAFDYENWTHAMRLEGAKGELITFGEIYDLGSDASTGRSTAKFRHLEAFMGALSRSRVPSRVAAWVKVSRRPAPGRIACQLTVQFHLETTPARVELVGGPEDNPTVARQALATAVAQLLKLPGVWEEDASRP